MTHLIRDHWQDEAQPFCGVDNATCAGAIAEVTCIACLRAAKVHHSEWLIAVIERRAHLFNAEASTPRPESSIEAP